MAGFWQWFTDRMGLGPTQEERIDRAAEQMQREIQLRKELAARTVALAREKRRELGEAVSRHEALFRAAVKLEQEGRADAVQYMAVELAQSQGRIETLTQEAEELNASAAESVETFRAEQQETQDLLRRHGQVKAAAQMNRELVQLQEQMKALTGASTAKGAYRAVVGEVETKTQELRALAELESADQGHKAEVARALQEVGSQEMLRLVQAEAAQQLPSGPSIIAATVAPLERARRALAQDPIRPLLPPAAGESPASGEEEAQS